eukprot:Gb_01294 [translate_table: standard]
MGDRSQEEDYLPSESIGVTGSNSPLHITNCLGKESIWKSHNSCGGNCISESAGPCEGRRETGLLGSLEAAIIRPVVDLYRQDLVQSAAQKGMVGMVTKVAGDSDSDSSSSDSEDQDETESIFEGHARIIWTSLTETIEKIDDILVVDRGFLHGDIVASVSDPSGQTGTVVNVDLILDLKTLGGETIRNVNSKKLLRVSGFAVGDYVIHGQWLGRVDEVVDNVTVQFDDSAKCKILGAVLEWLMPVSFNLLEDAHCPYHPGQRVRGSSSAVFKNAQWLRGTWKASHMVGTVSNVEVGSVYVKWIAAASTGHSSQLTITPSEQQEPKELKLLSCFSYANWQLGDWCLLPTCWNILESASAVSEYVVSDGDTKTVSKKDTSTTNSGSTVFGLKDTIYDHRILRSKKIHRHLLKDDKRGHKREDVLEQALFIVNTKTKVDVVWQDGTQSFCLDSRTLFPVDNLGDHDFWPEQYVLEKGSDEDGVHSDARRVGVVKSVDSKERMVRVKWIKPTGRPEYSREFDKEEVVSVYELVEHPDYSFRLGDIVIRLSSFPEAPVGSGIINQPGEHRECSHKLELESDEMPTELAFGEKTLRKSQHLKGSGSFEDLGLSHIGYIIGLRDGDIEVAWAEGTVSKVGPHAIIVVAREEDEGSSHNSFEEDAEENEDDAASWQTFHYDGLHVHGQEEQLEDVNKATLNQTDIYSDRDIATADGPAHAEEILQRNDDALSIPRAAFGFVSRLVTSLLGFGGSRRLSSTFNPSSQGQPTQQHFHDGNELGICQGKELIIDSQCDLEESATAIAKDALNVLDGSAAVLEGKEGAELCTSKFESEYNRDEGRVQSFKYSVDGVGESMLCTARNQEKEERSLSGLSGPHSVCFKHFDSVKEPVDHFFLNEMGQSSSQREWLKKVQQEWIILEKNLPETIYVRVYEDRMDLLRAAIIGAAGTPYQDGLFFFDIHLPTEYPHAPPSAYYHSGGLRLNPNLYENGKICLSLLNTWTGRGNEVWDPLNSSILQVLVSLQGLVLNARPYFNEAGYDKQIGKAEGEKNSLAYNENSFLLSCKSMLYLLRKPPKHFETFVKEHFRNRGSYILGACNAYMKGAQVGCLPEEAVMPLHDVANFKNSSSSGFKIMLAKLIPKLASAFSEVGVDCQEFLQTII